VYNRGGLKISPLVLLGRNDTTLIFHPVNKLKLKLNTTLCHMSSRAKCNVAEGSLRIRYFDFGCACAQHDIEPQTISTMRLRRCAQHYIEPQTISTMCLRHCTQYNIKDVISSEARYARNREIHNMTFRYIL